MTELKKTGKLDTYIFLIVVVLMTFGTAFVFSADVNLGREFEWSRFYDLAAFRQLIFYVLAIVSMQVFSRIDYHVYSLERGWLRSPLTYFLVLSAVLLILVLIPGIGVEVNYARRWLRLPLGPVRVNFQPSELAKWVAVFFTAGFCAKYGSSLRRFWKGFVPACGVCGALVGLIIIEDFGTAALISLLVFLLFMIAGAKLLYLFIPVPIMAAGFFAAIMSSEARKHRILAFMNPEKWTDSINYQPSQSLIALGSGGLFGKGLGEGISKYGHLPEDTTDFIFAIIGEELGLVGTTSVILMFALLVWLGLLVSMRSKDQFGQLLSAGIILAIGIQAILNIGVVTVVLPTKGIPLPFISAGGTSLLLTATAVGVLLNIASQAERSEVEK